MTEVFVDKNGLRKEGISFESEGENYAKYAPPSDLTRGVSSDLLAALVDTCIGKLALASLTVAEQKTAATIIGEHVRKLRNTLAALMK